MYGSFSIHVRQFFHTCTVIFPYMYGNFFYTCMVTKNVCIPYMRKNQPYNTSLANHTIHVFVTPGCNQVVIRNAVIITYGDQP